MQSPDPSPPARPARSPWPRRLAALAAGLVGAVLVGEAAVRLLTHTSPIVHVRDAAVGVRHLRSWTGDRWDDESGRSVTLRFNRDGFRGPDRPHAKPDGTVRIAVLGDSMIAAVAMEEAETACALLEARLNAERPERRWEVMNFGVASAAVGSELRLYENVVRDYDPDLVLGCYFTANDFADLSTRIRRNNAIYFDFDDAGELVQVSSARERSAGSLWLNRHSRLYRWQKALTSRARGVMAEDALSREHWIHCTVPDETSEHAWALSDALIRANQAAVEGDGRQYALVMVPAGATIHPHAFEDLARRAGVPGFDPDHAERTLAKLCTAANVRFLTLSPALRAAAAEGPEQGALFYADVGHFTERGNRVAADGLFALLDAGGEASLLAQLAGGS